MNRNRFWVATWPWIIVAVLGFAVAPIPVLAQVGAGSDWAGVIDNAKREGAVAVYVGGDFETVSLVFKAFEKKYGIRVDALEGRATEIRERIRAEGASGRAIGDVSINGSTTTAAQLGEGVFQQHPGLPAAARLVRPFVDDGTSIPISVVRLGMMINTDHVKPGDAPKSWRDLLDPKWKGRILSDDPRASGGAFVVFSVLYDKLGRAFHEKLAQQNLLFSRDLAVNERRIANGEYPIYIPLNLQNLRRLPGLPVRGIAPSEGVAYLTFHAAMIKRAPHPNAARLLMNFLLEDEAQQIIVSQGVASPVGVVAKSLPAQLPVSLMTGPLLGTTDPLRQDELMGIFRTIYK